MSETIQLAVLGDPLKYTRSPDLYRAGCSALGLGCLPYAARTPIADLEQRLHDLATRGFVGCNLTYPLKEHGLDMVARASVGAERARSVNTIAFRDDGWFGESTDGPGFIDLLKEMRYDVTCQRVVLLGAGGASRSLALALEWAGCRDVLVSARKPDDAKFAWGEGLEPRFLGWRSSEEGDALKDATVVVNCTPLTGAEGPADPAALSRTALVVDLTYQAELTPWVLANRKLGIHAIDGLGLLVHQARRSLSLWLGKEVPVEPLARAVGWPR